MAVSIRTDPEGPVRRGKVQIVTDAFMSFNPHRPRGAGETRHGGGLLAIF